jgi:hypothetical protein
MVIRTFIFTAMLAALSGTLAAQERPGASTAATAAGQAEAGLATPEARIAAAMDAAAEARIPTSLLANKVAEGEAKGIPGDRIATAVEARLSALIRAAGTLDRAGLESQSEGELLVTADALEAGVGEEALVAVSGRASGQRRVVAIAVLADLVRLGSEPGPASARVNAALGTNTSLANLSAEVAANAALSNLQAEVASQLQLEGLDSILDGLEGGGSGGLGGTLGLD